MKGLIDVARDGYLWFLQRGIGFVEGKPYVRQTVFRSLDPKAGRPDVDPDRKPATGKKAENICPSHCGGNWPPIAFSPKTRMIYIPANDNLRDFITGLEVEYEPGERYMGAQSGLPLVPGADQVGAVQAWNVDTGARGRRDLGVRGPVVSACSSVPGTLFLREHDPLLVPRDGSSSSGRRRAGPPSANAE